MLLRHDFNKPARQSDLSQYEWKWAREPISEPPNAPGGSEHKGLKEIENVMPVSFSLKCLRCSVFGLSRMCYFSLTSPYFFPSINDLKIVIMCLSCI